MPDITMCEGDGCPKREQCWRYTAEPSLYRQAYFIASPVKDGACEYFWKDETVKSEGQNKRG